ncbi:unnamed protein product [Ambrosiozyma monospora]|uniref:Unnamed protein product n=1 Tax=Ambrosiozyma monospora TaxID=43982 RepID=A0ACB5SY85_AMBMO|nr:unnamed protein product [Ambrosiozyma monospora]
MNPSGSISSNSSADPKIEADAYSYYLTSTIFLNKFLHVDLPKLSVETIPKTNSIQLKSLQALLLLATFGLLKPIKPGVWYIMLLAEGLINDMELYSEETLQAWEHFYGANIKNNSVNNNNQLVPHIINIKNLDINDLDRNNYSHTHRLTFWSFYSLERQVCCFVDKPFTLSDPDVTALPITTIMDPLQDDNLTVPSFFTELRNFQGKIHQFVNGSRASGFSLLNYIDLDSFTFQTHKSLNVLVLKFLDTISITRNPRLKNAVQTISDFAVLNYFSLIHNLYKPTINRAKLNIRELELLFKVSSQIVMTYDKLDSANKMTFKYMSIGIIHQACISYFYCLINAPKLCFNTQILKFLDKFVEIMSKLLSKLETNWESAKQIKNALVAIASHIRNFIMRVQMDNSQNQQQRSENNDYDYLIALLAIPNTSQACITEPIPSLKEENGNPDMHADDSLGFSSVLRNILNLVEVQQLYYVEQPIWKQVSQQKQQPMLPDNSGFLNRPSMAKKSFAIPPRSSPYPVIPYQQPQGQQQFQQSTTPTPPSYNPGQTVYTPQFGSPQIPFNSPHQSQYQTGYPVGQIQQQQQQPHSPFPQMPPKPEFFPVIQNQQQIQPQYQQQYPYAGALPGAPPLPPPLPTALQQQQSPYQPQPQQFQQLDTRHSPQLQSSQPPFEVTKAWNTLFSKPPVLKNLMLYGPPFSPLPTSGNPSTSSTTTTTTSSGPVMNMNTVQQRRSGDGSSSNSSLNTFQPPITNIPPVTMMPPVGGIPANGGSGSFLPPLQAQQNVYRQGSTSSNPGSSISGATIPDVPQGGPPIG